MRQADGSRADGSRADGSRTAGRNVEVRPVRPGDRAWLIGTGFSPELAGRQYHWAETPLQLVIAPLRALLGPHVAAGIIEVDGRRAGYVGRSPLSGNLEYFTATWARGGIGKRAIATFLATGRPGDKPRRFVISRKNERSLAALRSAFGSLGWVEGDDYRVVEDRLRWSVWVGPGTTSSTSMPTSTE